MDITHQSQLKKDISDSFRVDLKYMSKNREACKL